MKLTFIVVGILSFGGLPVNAEIAGPRTITVFGASESYIVPDRVEWKLTIRARENSADKATAATDQVLENTIATLASLGLSAEDVQVGRAAMTRQFSSKDGMPTAKVSYYESSQILKFVETDVSQFELYRRAFMDVEGLEVQHVQVSTAADSVRTSVQVQALGAAKKKAEELAAVVGATVGKAISISEFRPEATNRDYEIALQSGVVFFPRPEEIRFEAKIYAVFELEYGDTN